MKAFVAASLFIVTAAPLGAAEPISDDVRCVPVEQRAGKTLGCYVLAREPLSELPKAPIYWHLYEYPSRAAADRAKGKQGSVIESYGKVWLMNVGDANWSAAGGRKVARVGPLPVESGG